MNIAELYEKKAALLKKIEEAAKKAKTRGDGKDGLEGLDLETMNTEFDGWYAELETIEKSIGQLERAEKLLAEQAKPIEDSKVDKGNDKEAYNRAFHDWVKNGNSRLKPESKEILTRANQFYTTDAYGGYTIPELMGPEIVAAKAYIGGMLTPGLCRTIQTSGGEAMTVPVVDDTSTVGYLLTEKTDATSSASDMTFTIATLNAYKYTSGMVKVSRELLNDSAFNFADWLRDMLLERYYRGLNYAFTLGSGSSQPQGVRGAAYKGEDALSRSITRTNISNLMYSINRAYFFNGTFMFNSTTLKAIRALVQSSTYNESPLWQESMRSGEPGTLEGKPWIVNENMDDIKPIGRPVLFGDFKHFWIREAGPLRLVRLDERYAETDEVAFAVLGRVDSELVVASTAYPIAYIRNTST